MRVAKHYLQVGILEVVGDEHARDVRIVTPAPLLRHNHGEAQRLRAKLRPEHKTHAKAGAAGGGYWTPYKETMRDVRSLLAKAGPQGLSLGEIMGQLGKHHWANERSMRSCLPTALESYEKDPLGRRHGNGAQVRAVGLRLREHGQVQGQLALDGPDDGAAHGHDVNDRSAVADLLVHVPVLRLKPRNHDGGQIRL